MDPTLAQRILQDRRTAFVLTDRRLVVTDLGGVTGLLQPDTAGWRGRPLPDLVPELVGSEAALADVLAGDLPRLEMAWINREQAGGQGRSGAPAR